MRGFWEWLKNIFDTSPVPSDHCWKCRVPYVVEPVHLVFSARFGPVPERDVLMEVCPQCGGAGRAMGPAPQPAPVMPSASWRKFDEAWVTDG